RGQSLVHGMRRKLALLAAAAGGGGALPLSCAKQFHARLIVASPCIPDDLRLRLLRSYAAHGEFASAHRLLDEAPRPASPLLYNAVIRAHSRRLDLPTALALFASMRRSATPPDAHTFACVLRACADCDRPGGAKTLHGIASTSGWSSHPIVGSALVSAYSKFLLVESARHVFDGLREPDLVLWNSMMSGYGYREMWLEGLQLFSAMRRAGEEPDGYSMVSLLSSFWDPEALAFGQAVHGVCIKGGYDSGHHGNCRLASMMSHLICSEKCATLAGGLTAS
uniref:Pentacotripeptide-repeat region of PRORP domain-containing protein n=1 Tax=Aegilops tauschii subsp. strangulata TaxID=200361 RepID=A0A453FYS6_AEGTS